MCATIDLYVSSWSQSLASKPPVRLLVGRIDFYKQQLGSLNRALAAMHWHPLDPSKLDLALQPSLAQAALSAAALVQDPKPPKPLASSRPQAGAAAGAAAASAGASAGAALPLLSTEREAMSSRVLAQGEKQARGLADGAIVQEGGQRSQAWGRGPAGAQMASMELRESALLTGAHTARGDTRTRALADVLYRPHRITSPATKARVLDPLSRSGPSHFSLPRCSLPPATIRFAASPLCRLGTVRNCNDGCSRAERCRASAAECRLHQPEASSHRISLSAALRDALSSCLRPEGSAALLAMGISARQPYGELIPNECREACKGHAGYSPGT
jgi:hypothetical protein